MTTQPVDHSDRVLLKELHGQIFDLALAQTQAWLTITHGLMTDQSISQETRDSAKEAFERVDSMIITLQKLADLSLKINGEQTNE